MLILKAHHKGFFFFYNMINMYDCIFCLVTRMRNARLNILLPIVLHMIGFNYASVGALEENTRGYTGNTTKRTKKKKKRSLMFFTY